jgi:2-amino-4-hydroxy-6-hydroxymethyldihydropteridine diphosphokinase
MTKNNHQFLIALGSNIGLATSRPVDIIKEAIIELSKSGIILKSLSRFYETPAYPKGSGPNFVNSVVKAETNYSAYAILQRLHKIEEKFERRRNSRWSARTLDLDLLALEEQVLPSKEVFQYWCDLPLSEQKKKTPNELLLPHPRIQDRAFVLLPLLDVEPNWLHPILNKTAVQLYQKLPEQTKKNIQTVQ